MGSHRARRWLSRRHIMPALARGAQNSADALSRSRVALPSLFLVRQACSGTCLMAHIRGGVCELAIWATVIDRIDAAVGRRIA